MKEIKTQVSSIEAAINAALERKKMQLNLKEKEFSHKLNQIKTLLIEIETDLESFDNPLLPEKEDKIVPLSDEEELKKLGRPSPEDTYQAYISILKILDVNSELTILEIVSKLNDKASIQFKKTTRKRIEKLEKEGKIEIINKDPSREIQRNLKYRITEKGKNQIFPKLV